MNAYLSRANRKTAILFLTALCFSSTAGSLFAGRPTAAKLLPENTLVMVSVPDAKALAEKFMNTNLGRMLKDPQMTPFIETLYGSLGELVETAKEQIGLSLADIVALPQGEITFAMLFPDGEPSMVFIFEAGDKIANARVLLERGKQALQKSGEGKIREETIADVKCTIFERNDGSNENRKIVVFEKDSAIAICTNIEVAKQVLAIWAEKKDAKTLAENANYAAIANRCRGTKDEEPQFIWYVDPIGIFKATAQQNIGVQMVVATFPAIGLDGLSGIGGSVLFDTEQFDALMHLHVLLTNPRTGIIKAIAFEPGATKPERWVPNDVATYVTLNWNFKTSLKAIETLFDSYRGEGSFEKTMHDFFTAQLDVDLQKQIVPALEGRLSYITWIEKPVVNFQSSTLLAAFKLKDKNQDKDNNVESIEKILDGIAKKYGEVLGVQTYGGKTYYRIKVPQPPRFNEADEPPPLPNPCFGIVEDYFMISNQPRIYEQVLATAADSSKSLANELDFKLVAGKLQRMTGGTKPAMLGFQRPEENMKFFYDLATSDRAKSGLQSGAERNPFLKSVNSAMDKNPLPPFSVLQKYFAPQGSMVIDDETGIHLMDFTLKRKTE